MRKIGVLAALLAALALTGCDKCTGGLQDIRFPAPPAACSR
jgi:hypothetical protein